FHLSRLAYDFFRFIATYRGRGALYLILGFIVYDQDKFFFLFATYYSVSAGLIFFIISFVPHLLPLNDMKANYRAYRQYIEELNDPYAIPSHSFIDRDSQHLAENGNDTIRTSAARDIHTIRTAYDQNKENKLLRGKSLNLPVIKGDATLAMEINAALLDVHYSDFATPSEEHISPQPEQMSAHSAVKREVSFRTPLEAQFSPNPGAARSSTNMGNLNGLPIPSTTNVHSSPGSSSDN
ncbi:hypothetical protein L0F63_003500, partial [Massospora cicadina]